MASQDLGETAQLTEEKPPTMSSTASTTKTPLPTKNSSSFLTRSSAFKRLTKWAFSVCDSDGTGQLGKTELYAGILLVHLNLAKYAGAAACYPPTRQVIDGLFDASDDDNSGYIDASEFEQILVICCAQIASRMLVYFLIIIMLVPYVAEGVILCVTNADEWFGLALHEKGTFFEMVEKLLTTGGVAERIVSTLLFFLVVPLLFNYIDRSSKETAETGIVGSTATVQNKTD